MTPREAAESRPPSHLLVSIRLVSAIETQLHMAECCNTERPDRTRLETTPSADAKHHMRRISLKRLRQPLQITRADFNFDKNHGLSYQDLQDEVERSRVYDPTAKHQLVEIFIYVANLCTLLTDLITLVFPAEHVLDEELPLDSRELGRIRDCRAALKILYESAMRDFPVPAETGTPITNMPSMGRDFYHESTLLYTNVMYMYYYSAKAALSHYDARRFATMPTLSAINASLTHPSAAQDGTIDLEFASGVSDQSLPGTVHNAASCSHSSLDKNPFNDLWPEFERYWDPIPTSLSAECDIAGHGAGTNDMGIEASQSSQSKKAKLPPESLGVYTPTAVLPPEVRTDTDLDSHRL